MESINIDITSSVGTIRLNRPTAYNSVNKSLALELQSQLDAFEQDENIRAILLTGEGKAFCAGQDLVEITTPELNPGLKKILDEHYSHIITRLRAIPKPIVAAVNGVAAGAGANIALACDVVIATKSASFIQAFSGIGLIPDSAGTYFLPRLIGFQKALAIAMLGDKISATEAEQMGMIYKCVEDDDFIAYVEKIVQRLAFMPTKALALTKKAFNQGITNSLPEQLILESKLQIEASETADFEEGLDAFINKRKPNFKGK